MEVHLTPDLEEKLAHSAANQGRGVDALFQGALIRYLTDEPRLFEALEGWTDDDRLGSMSHIEEGFLQAERGELIDGDQARQEIRAFKDSWRKQRESAR